VRNRDRSEKEGEEEIKEDKDGKSTREEKRRE
jgi:hypothetical protein